MIWPPPIPVWRSGLGPRSKRCAKRCATRSRKRCCCTGAKRPKTWRNEILRNAPLSRIEPRQVEQMRRLIRQIARRLRERFSKPRKRQRRGHLDVRRDHPPQRPRGAAFHFSPPGSESDAIGRRSWRCATSSGSVARVSDFFLLLIHSLHEVVSDVRSFAFSGHLIEVSDILEKKSPEEAMQEIMAKVGFGSSDYGGSFADFEKQWMSSITQQTHGDHIGRRAFQQSRSPRRYPAPHRRTLEAVGLAQPRGDAWPGDLAIPKCRATRRSVASSANAPPRSSWSERCPDIVATYQ